MTSTPGGVTLRVRRRGDGTMIEAKEMTVAELAGLCGGTVEGDSTRILRGPAGLEEAGPEDVSFLAQANYAALAQTTEAGAILVADGVELDAGDAALIRCADPERAFTKVVLAFAPEAFDLPGGVHPTAVVDPAAEVDPSARIAAHVVVDAGAKVGANTRLHAGVVVGAHATVGADCDLRARVTLAPHTVLGDRCVIHSGAVLGSDGFGFHFDGTAWHKTPQVGHVAVGDDVEIGANTAIDCARFGATRIGSGTKIDNLVHIAHNCRIGRGCLVLAHVGIAGSTVVEDGAILAGQVGVGGHLRVGKGARIAGGSGVTKNVPAGEEWFGYPAGPSREKYRAMVRLERAGAGFAGLERRVTALEKASEPEESR